MNIITKSAIALSAVAVAVGLAGTAQASPQDQAVRKAEQYLNYTAFSEQGLIEQLEYDSFSASDATAAVAQIEASGEVDWNEQAAKKGKQYLDYTSFSQQGLVEQLEHDGFTPAQAQHGVAVAYS